MFNSKRVRILKLNTKVIYILPIILMAIILILGFIMGGIDSFNKSGIKYIERNGVEYYYYIYSVFGVKYQAVALLIWAIIIIPIAAIAGAILGIICNAYLLHIYYLASINKQLINGISAKEIKQKIVAPTINNTKPVVKAPSIEPVKVREKEEIKKPEPKEVEVKSIITDIKPEEPKINTFVEPKAEEDNIYKEPIMDNAIIADIPVVEEVKEEVKVEEIVDSTPLEKIIEEVIEPTLEAEAPVEEEAEAVETPAVEEEIVEEIPAVEEEIIEEIPVVEEEIIEEIPAEEEAQVVEEEIIEETSDDDDFLAALDSIPEANSFEMPNSVEEIEETVEYVDEDGNPVDEFGNPIVTEEVVYVDEDGNEIDPSDIEVIEEEIIEEVVEEAPKPKRGRPRKKVE